MKSSFHPPNLRGLLPFYTELGQVTCLANTTMAHRTQRLICTYAGGSHLCRRHEKNIRGIGCWTHLPKPAKFSSPTNNRRSPAKNNEPSSHAQPQSTEPPDDLGLLGEPRQDQQSHPAMISAPSAKPPNARANQHLYVYVIHRFCLVGCLLWLLSKDS